MNMLKFPQVVALSKWIDMQRPFILERRPSENVAADATTALGFEVSHHNIQSIAKALGFTWSASPRTHARTSPKNVNRILAGAIVQLYQSLGSAAPDEISNIARGRKSEQNNSENLFKPK